jgi:hypothetical protein
MAVAPLHRNFTKPQGPYIFGIGTKPKFAIGQRTLDSNRQGNLLWDCILLVHDATSKTL